MCFRRLSPATVRANSTTWRLRAWPDSLLARIVLVMAIGVISAQLVGTFLLARQLRENVRVEALSGGRFLASNAADFIRFFRNLPPAYRPILVEQLRTMGGTRFFVNVNREPVPVTALADNPLVNAVVGVVRAELMRTLSTDIPPQVSFAWPQGLKVSDDGRLVADLPESWVEATLLIRPRPAPILVIQTEFEKGHWLYLAATMPDPYFLDIANPLTLNHVIRQLVTLCTVLLLAVWMVRGLVQPLDRIAQAANAFGSAIAPESISETGTAELRRTARAFNAMQARIQGYLVDRERLFIGISHSLKTPIMRLKLRTELLDDEAMRNEFHEDLDDLDVMVKSALQTLRDTDIHENLVEVRLDRLLVRLVQRPILPNADITYLPMPMRIHGKPLALQRALGNLVDNAVLYGDRVQVRLSRMGNLALVEIRDFGPGLPESDMTAAFEPHARLGNSRERNRAGSGLGLGISRNIVQAHGGEIRLHNHADGGLVVSVLLPAMPDEAA
jgi:signal transduction histidine kinase